MALGAQGAGWAFACPHVVASEAAADAFRAGGNAIDAALAAAAVLPVVYPHMNHLGGDIFALVAAPDGTVTAVNGSGAAPALVDVEAVRASSPDGLMPIRGPYPVTVPGAVGAWGAIHGLGARRPLAAALTAAIGLAADGMTVVPGLAAAIAEDRDLLAADPGLGALFLDGDGAPLPAGATVRQPALARTLEAIAAEGPAALYGGEVGAALVACLRAHGSAITLDDLVAHRTELLPPVGATTRGVEVLTAPPNSQGLLTPLILRALELGEVADPFGADAGLTAALYWRASRVRETLISDPRVMQATAADLLADEHVAQVLEDARVRAAGGGPAPAASREPNGDTIGLVAADADGWRVVIIQSIYYGWGSGILDPATGILCQNRGAHFSLDPDALNVLAGGKRTAHTLMPIMLRREGRVIGVHGTMGGTAQAQIHAQLVLRVLSGLDAAAAVDAPRMVVGRNRSEPDDITLLESRLPATAVPAVRAARMPLVELDAYTDDAGHSHVIRVLDGQLDVGSDPRADGAAVAG